MLGSSLFACSLATIPRQPPFGTSLDSFVCLLVHVLSPTPLTKLPVPTLYTPSGPAPKPVCGVVVCFTAATSNNAVAFWDGLANAHRLTEFEHVIRQRHSHDTQDHRRGGDRSQETPTDTQLSCRRQGSPTSIDYRSGERARITMRPQTKCARSQGTTSPQISVTFRHFSYQPIIWHRGPRPRAHWYMCTDVANYQNHHRSGQSLFKIRPDTRLSSDSHGRGFHGEDGFLYEHRPMGVSGHALWAVQRTQYFPAADEHSF